MYIKTFLKNILNFLFFIDVTKLMKSLRSRQADANDLLQITQIALMIKKQDSYPNYDIIYKYFRKSPLLSFIKFEKKSLVYMFFLHSADILVSLLGIFLAIQILATFEAPSIPKFQLVNIFFIHPTIWDKFLFTLILAFLIFFLNMTAASCHAQKIEREMFLEWRIPFKITQAMYNFLLNMSAKARETFKTGDITNIVQNDARNITGLFAHAFVDFFVIFVACVLITSFMLFSFGQIAWFGVLVILLQIPCSIFFAWVGVKLHKKLMQYSDKRIHGVTELIQGMRLIRYLGWGPYFEKDIQNTTNKEFFQDTKLALQFCFSFSLIANIWMFISSAIFAGYLLYSNQVRDASILFGIIWLARLFGQQIAPLPWFLHVFAQSIVASKRIKNFFVSKTQDEEFESDHNQELNSNQIAIINKIIKKKYHELYSISFDFENVYFKYLDSGPYILDNVSFTINENQTIAIVGPVGSGKTTILKILIGEYSPTKGTVHILIHLKDQTIKINLHSKIGMKLLRAVQSYVPQEPFIVTSSIRENIAFEYDVPGHPIPYDERIMNSILQVSLMHDVSKFPDHMETEVGERGINLSGGQKQRISLARKVYQNLKVVFMDDPFSAVDFDTETEIIKNIFSSENKRQKTVLWTTHRFQHLNVSDRVLVLENGKIHER